IFSLIFVFWSKKGFHIPPVKEQLLLILSVGIMQFSTNYVFANMKVSYALALFQLSALLSVFLGVNIFNEKGFARKILASAIMVIGAVIIILG
ncbi:EamA family transporter, partial [bacterium]|nr:EamA family transporter [bacterium]